MDSYTCPKCRSNLYAPDFDGWSCVACGYKRRYPRNDTQKAPPSEAEIRASRQREWREKRDWNNAKAMWRTIKRQHERTNATPQRPIVKSKPAPAKPASPKPTPPKPDAPSPTSYAEIGRAKLNERYKRAHKHLRHYREWGDLNDLTQAARLLRECFEHIHAAKNAQPLHALATEITAEYDKRIPIDD